MKLKTKQKLLQKRCWRIRKKVHGTTERPRLSLKFTNQHIYAQCIDDVRGQTLVSANSIAKAANGDKSILPNKEGSNRLGEILAQRALSVGIKAVVLDRTGRRYHGCVQSFADAARKAGLSF